ncbi:hypothetical protein AMAG_02545 [Allomyces macrogynus ATCC 38327]|uniref:Uncharacterized protein n=1 Tax=Allomyces macrogynus (strain ATCC 38327) TaxID=578462 RepID=A0A0L0S319_ALLM3|nr:hypothetical protein AMAG_02545 [Allomyces macrogynus ATCC 38327]|eukprot:KNE56769.1 hypothetical protein AMAG_02545 [Allomyces macrogynus ATCC 38327]
MTRLPASATFDVSGTLDAVSSHLMVGFIESAKCLVLATARGVHHQRARVTMRRQATSSYPPNQVSCTLTYLESKAWEPADVQFTIQGHEILADACVEDGERDKACMHYDAAIQTIPSGQLAHFVGLVEKYVALLVKLHEHSKALRVVEKVPENALTDKLKWVVAQFGYIAHRQTYLSHLLARYPHVPELLAAAQRVGLSLADIHAATESARSPSPSWLVAHPFAHDPELTARAGDLLARQMQWKDARAQFDRVWLLDPWRVRGMDMYVLVLKQIEPEPARSDQEAAERAVQWERSVQAVVQRLSRIARESVEAAVANAVWAWHVGALEEARRSLDLAEKIEPGYRLARLVRGHLDLLENDLRLAISIAKDLLQQTPDLLSYHFALSAFSASEDWASHALVVAREALPKYPANAEAIGIVANAYLLHGGPTDKADAVALLEKLVVQHPTCESALRLLCTEYPQRLTPFTGKSETVLVERGIALDLEGQTLSALNSFIEAQTRVPRSIEAQQCIVRMNEKLHAVPGDEED